MGRLEDEEWLDVLHIFPLWDNREVDGFLIGQEVLLSGEDGLFYLLYYCKDDYEWYNLPDCKFTTFQKAMKYYESNYKR